jgi:phospholipase C
MIGLDTYCNAEYGSDVVPPIPYGTQTLEEALFYEDGFKGVRGALTEGRHLVFEALGYALTSGEAKLTGTKATAAHETPSQRLVIHINELGGNQFKISDDSGDKWLGESADWYDSEDDGCWCYINYVGNGAYNIQQVDGGKYVNLKGAGHISIAHDPVNYSLYSVSYHT